MVKKSSRAGFNLPSSFPRKRESVKIGTVPQVVISLRSGLSLFLHKLVSSLIVCAFLINDLSYANPDTLSTLIGNPETYQRMRAMMMARCPVFVTPAADVAVEIKDDNGYIEITIKGGDAYAVKYQDRVYIDFEKIALFFDKEYPKIVTRLRTTSRKPAELVHCHEIFHLMIDSISFYSRLGLKYEEEETLANVFAMKALGVKLSPRELQLLAEFSEKIEREKKDADYVTSVNSLNAFLIQLELPYSTAEPPKEGKPDFFYNLARNLDIDLSEIYRATITGINDAVWTFASGKSIDVGPEARARILVGEPHKAGAPGFVWAGVKDDSGKWSNCRKIPLTENSAGQHEAVLPEDINAFTFFWTGGEDVRSGQSQGHWEGQDFYINRYAAGTPLVQQSVTRNFSEEQTIARISLEIARTIHDNGFEAILLTGNSALLPKILLVAAWKRLYGEETMPLIYLIDHESRVKLLNGVAHIPTLEEIFRKAIGDNDGSLLKGFKAKKLICVDDYLWSGIKRTSVDRMLKTLGFRQPVYHCFFTAPSNQPIFAKRFPVDIITNLGKFTFVGSYEDEMVRVIPALANSYFQAMTDSPAVEPSIRERIRKYVEKIIAEVNSIDTKPGPGSAVHAAMPTTTGGVRCMSRGPGAAIPRDPLRGNPNGLGDSRRYFFPPDDGADFASPRRAERSVSAPANAVADAVPGAGEEIASASPRNDADSISKDIENGLKMLEGLNPEAEKQDEVRYYTVRYDKSRIPQGSPAEEALKVCVNEFMKSKLRGKDRIKLVASEENGKGLIWAESYKDRARSDGRKAGEGRVDVTHIDDGSVLRIVAMVNMALAASDDDIEFVKKQYEDITGEPPSESELRKIGEGAWGITLPRAEKIPSADEYYRLTVKKLREAA